MLPLFLSGARACSKAQRGPHLVIIAIGMVPRLVVRLLLLFGRAHDGVVAGLAVGGLMGGCLLGAAAWSLVSDG
jgi:hypothetical protein